MKLLHNLCVNLRPTLSGTQERDVTRDSQVILQTLIEKLGDNLQKVRVAAEDAILAMCDHPTFGVKVCMNALIRATPIPQASKAAKKTMNSNK